MQITPNMLETAYTFLRTTKPFRAWSLPEADDVEFRVTRDKNTMGMYEFRSPSHIIIHISEILHHDTNTLLMTVAHEMVHMHEDRCGVTFHKSRLLEHGSAFRRVAAKVCRAHGWTLSEF